MIETVLVIEGFLGRVLDSAPPFGGVAGPGGHA